MSSQQGITRGMWANLYADLYRQVFGEKCTTADIMRDVEQRRRIIAENDRRLEAQENAAIAAIPADQPTWTPRAERDRIQSAIYDTYTEAELADQAAIERWLPTRSPEDY